MTASGCPPRKGKTNGQRSATLDAAVNAAKHTKRATYCEVHRLCWQLRGTIEQELIRGQVDSAAAQVALTGIAALHGALVLVEDDATRRQEAVDRAIEHLTRELRIGQEGCHER